MVKNRAKIVIYHKIKSKYREKFTNEGLIGSIHKPSRECPPPHSVRHGGGLHLYQNRTMGEANESVFLTNPTKNCIFGKYFKRTNIPSTGYLSFATNGMCNMNELIKQKQIWQ